MAKAFKSKRSNDKIKALFLMLVGLPFIASTNIDCNGKSFHCVNSTHFMICVDLGSGVSSTIDDFVIQCPPTTMCQRTNHFECEFYRSTTSLPIKVSEVSYKPITTTSQPWEEISETISPSKHVSERELENYYNTISVTTEGKVINDITSKNPMAMAIDQNSTDLTVISLSNEYNSLYTTNKPNQENLIETAIETTNKDTLIDSRNVVVPNGLEISTELPHNNINKKFSTTQNETTTVFVSELTSEDFFQATTASSLKIESDKNVSVGATEAVSLDYVIDYTPTKSIVSTSSNNATDSMYDLSTSTTLATDTTAFNSVQNVNETFAQENLQQFKTIPSVNHIAINANDATTDYTVKVSTTAATLSSVNNEPITHIDKKITEKNNEYTLGEVQYSTGAELGSTSLQQFENKKTTSNIDKEIIHVSIDPVRENSQQHESSTIDIENTQHFDFKTSTRFMKDTLFSLNKETSAAVASYFSYNTESLQQEVTSTMEPKITGTNEDWNTEENTEKYSTYYNLGGQNELEPTTTTITDLFTPSYYFTINTIADVNGDFNHYMNTEENTYQPSYGDNIDIVTIDNHRNEFQTTETTFINYITPAGQQTTESGNVDVNENPASIREGTNNINIISPIKLTNKNYLTPFKRIPKTQLTAVTSSFSSLSDTSEANYQDFSRNLSESNSRDLPAKNENNLLDVTDYNDTSMKDSALSNGVLNLKNDIEKELKTGQVVIISVTNSNFSLQSGSDSTATNSSDKNIIEPPIELVTSSRPTPTDNLTNRESNAGLILDPTQQFTLPTINIVKPVTSDSKVKEETLAKPDNGITINEEHLRIINASTNITFSDTTTNINENTDVNKDLNYKANTEINTYQPSDGIDIITTDNHRNGFQSTKTTFKFLITSAGQHTTESGNVYVDKNAASIRQEINITNLNKLTNTNYLTPVPSKNVPKSELTTVTSSFGSLSDKSEANYQDFSRNVSKSYIQDGENSYRDLQATTETILLGLPDYNNTLTKDPVFSVGVQNFRNDIEKEMETGQVVIIPVTNKNLSLQSGSDSAITNLSDKNIIKPPITLNTMSRPMSHSSDNLTNLRDKNAGLVLDPMQQFTLPTINIQKSDTFSTKVTLSTPKNDININKEHQHNTSAFSNITLPDSSSNVNENDARKNLENKRFDLNTISVSDDSRNNITANAAEIKVKQNIEYSSHKNYLTIKNRGASSNILLFSNENRTDTFLNSSDIVNKTENSVSALPAFGGIATDSPLATQVGNGKEKIMDYSESNVKHDKENQDVHSSKFNIFPRFTTENRTFTLLLNDLGAASQIKNSIPNTLSVSDNSVKGMTLDDSPSKGKEYSIYYATDKNNVYTLTTELQLDKINVDSNDNNIKNNSLTESVFSLGLVNNTKTDLAISNMNATKSINEQIYGEKIESGDNKNKIEKSKADSMVIKIIGIPAKVTNSLFIPVSNSQTAIDVKDIQNTRNTTQYNDFSIDIPTTTKSEFVNKIYNNAASPTVPINKEDGLTGPKSIFLVSIHGNENTKFASTESSFLSNLTQVDPNNMVPSYPARVIDAALSDIIQHKDVEPNTIIDDVNLTESKVATSSIVDEKTINKSSIIKNLTKQSSSEEPLSEAKTSTMRSCIYPYVIAPEAATESNVQKVPTEEGTLTSSVTDVQSSSNKNIIQNIRFENRANDTESKSLVNSNSNYTEKVLIIENTAAPSNSKDILEKFSPTEKNLDNDISLTTITTVSNNANMQTLEYINLQLTTTPSTAVSMGVKKNNSDTAKAKDISISNTTTSNVETRTHLELTNVQDSQTETENESSKNRKIHKPTTQFSCSLRNRGRYSDENDCRKYYVCFGKKQPMFGTCPNNTVFSETIRQCTKNLSQCIRKNEFQCTAAGRFSDNLKQNIYYVCSGNGNDTFVRFKFQCQNDHYLNKETVKCEYKLNKPEKPKPMKQTELERDDNSSIEVKSNEEQKSQSFENTSKLKENKKSKISDEDKKSKPNIDEGKKARSNEANKLDNKNKLECEEDGKYPDPEDCRKYYVCSRRRSAYRRRKKSCDSDEVFDKDKKKCVDEESYECS